jgi:hypothetical protein
VPVLRVGALYMSCCDAGQCGEARSSDAFQKLLFVVEWLICHIGAIYAGNQMGPMSLAKCLRVVIREQLPHTSKMTHIQSDSNGVADVDLTCVSRVTTDGYTPLLFFVPVISMEA